MKSIAVLMATVCIDMLGAAMVFPLVPFYAVDLGAEPWVVGWIIAGFPIAQLAASPLWGRFSDRYGRRPALLAGLLASALAFVVFGLARTTWLLVLSRVVQGAGGGTTGVAQAYVGDSIAPEQRAKALGWLSAATSAGVMIGPALGSFASSFGHAAPGLVAAALCLVNVAFAWAWLPESRPAPATGDAASAPRRSVREFTLEVLRRPSGDVPLLIWVYTAGMLGFMSMTAVLGLFLRERHGVSEATIGYFFVLTGAIGLVMRGALLGRLLEWLGEIRLMRLGAVLIVAGLLSMPLARDLWLLLACMALVPVGTACLFPATSALVSQRAPREEMGQVLGVQQAFGGAARVIAPLWATAAFQSLGPPVPFYISAAVVAVAGLLALRARPATRAPELGGVALAPTRPRTAD